MVLVNHSLIFSCLVMLSVYGITQITVYFNSLQCHIKIENKHFFQCLWFMQFETDVSRETLVVRPADRSWHIVKNNKDSK